MGIKDHDLCFWVLNGFGCRVWERIRLQVLSCYRDKGMMSGSRFRGCTGTMSSGVDIVPRGSPGTMSALRGHCPPGPSGDNVRAAWTLSSGDNVSRKFKDV